MLKQKQRDGGIYADSKENEHDLHYTITKMLSATRPSKPTLHTGLNVTSFLINYFLDFITKN